MVSVHPIYRVELMPCDRCAQERPCVDLTQGTPAPFEPCTLCATCIRDALSAIEDAGHLPNRARVVGRGTKTGHRYDLKTLRAALGKTQAEIAQAARMSQGDISRLEGREDVKLSTLARYAAALGGGVEVAVVVGGRRYVLDLTD